MKINLPTLDEPVQGKTYSLYGNSKTTADYDHQIRELADICLQKCPDIQELLSQIQKASTLKRLLRKQLTHQDAPSLLHFIVNTAHTMLAQYTVNVQNHLQHLSILKFWDRILFTSEEQYHLYMLEIELVNRIFAQSFQHANQKLAFLPHCLRDFSGHCRSAKDGLDYVCRGCSPKCFISHISKILKQHDVVPYIWMTARLQSLLPKLQKESSLGVLGIACLPELVRGIRLCMHFKIPVIGIPLNANRCLRWMGAFYPNSVNLEQLEEVLGGKARKIVQITT